MKNAFELIEPSFTKMKELLFPIRLGLWAKLALVALLAGFGGGGGFNGNAGNNWGQSRASEQNAEKFLSFLEGFWAQWWQTIVGIVIFLLIFGLVLAFLSSVFKFVFYDGITGKEQSVKTSFMRNLKPGASLFGFMILYGVVVLALMALTLVFMLYPIFTNRDFEAAPEWMGSIFVSLCFLCCILLPLLLVASLVIEDFIIPTMFLTRKGFLSSAGHSIGIITKNFVQFLVFIAARIVLGIVLGIVSVILLLPLIIPLVLIAFLFFMSFIQNFDVWSLTARDIVVGIVILVPASLIFGYLAQLLTLPATVLSRFFPLMFLRECDPELDFEGQAPSL